MKNSVQENIQEHSLQVAVIAHALAVIKNKLFDGKVNSDRIAMMAIYHDANEIITGDMPTPIKYFNTQIRQVYNEIEEISNEKLISYLPDEMKDEFRSLLFFESDIESYKIVKAADRIAAYVKCIEERKAGNGDFRKAEESIFASIQKIDLPEVKYFMENFIKSFNLTLDELD
jgi:5'-deoxynucleotidase